MTNESRHRLPPWSMAIAAMLSVQLGAALSINVFATVGPAGTAWLRLTAGALILLALVRPRLREIRRNDVPTLLGLGVASGLMSVMFLSALERIPLGTCAAIESLGPLVVAAARAHSRAALIWPALAASGVVLLTRPWTGSIDVAGIAFAGVAAVSWGLYIVLTQRVGDRFDGITSLALTVPTAAIVAGVIGIPEAIGHVTIGAVVVCAGLALLFPVVPFALEIFALRGMTHSAFGTLMALEPAFGVLIGLLVLRQPPSLTQTIGILLVVAAGAGAQHRGARRSSQEKPIGHAAGPGDVRSDVNARQ
jgi:inner membrane transporter RhtA